ncbi:hypothetical protein FISHEDRAFT_76187 [Fistulina hepatica ATCC 64428]|uniref:BOD1/SHG1 domain-containing protein n=1 Tax=Fistulina hepatica ATCC 64428 TaxID=1128425 RepID=A0A0D7A562_9AGAR|nr:hypothetical protein FISHEDRAFT_76187 [Fistulina hepatica ATCC 64428]
MSEPGKITTPAQLVEEFKRSGEFDRLRRELLSSFQKSDNIDAFKSRTRDIARKRLEDPNFPLLALDARQKELMQELQRYPTVENAVRDLDAFSDPELLEGLEKSLKQLLQDRNNPKPVDYDQGRHFPSSVMENGCLDVTGNPTDAKKDAWPDTDDKAPAMDVDAVLANKATESANSMALDSSPPLSGAKDSTGEDISNGPSVPQHMHGSATFAASGEPPEPEKSADISMGEAPEEADDIHDKAEPMENVSSSGPSIFVPAYNDSAYDSPLTSEAEDDSDDS